MPISIEGHPAEVQLSWLMVVISAQNTLFAPVQQAALRANGLGTDADRNDYQSLCTRIQAMQTAREYLRDQALAHGASPRLVKKVTQGAERKYTRGY